MTGDSSDLGSRLDTNVPHGARMWNYWLGGKDNFAADREVGDQVIAVYPEIVDVARESRAFLIRVVRYLVGEVGIRQFLDVGTGLPTADNTHEVAQRIAPESKIVYVDNDPLVLVHARALLTSTPQGATAYVDADVRDPDKILQAAAQTITFDQPVGLMLLGILGYVEGYDEARSIVNRLVEAVPSGSYLVINDGTISEERELATQVGTEAGVTYIPRTPQQITSFFDGLDLVEPGVVSTPLWRPEVEEPRVLNVYCGVGRKP
jgi:hypothetical protein